MNIVQSIESEIPTKWRSTFNFMIITAVSAFFGAISQGQIPSTLEGWRHILPGSLSAALAAEVILLRTMSAKALASATVAQGIDSIVIPSSPAPAPVLTPDPVATSATPTIAQEDQAIAQKGEASPVVTPPPSSPTG